MRLIPPAFAALLLAAAASSVAVAAEDAKPVVNRVDVNKVGLPIVWRGRLVNYVFVAVRLNLTPRADAQLLRAREPYFRDALVRLGHRTSFNDGADLSRVDERALDAAMLVQAQRIAGPGLVSGVEVLKQQPRRRLGRSPGDAPPAGRPITP